MLNNTFIMVEPGEDNPAYIRNTSFPNIPTALQYMMDNTGILDNNQKFCIIDFNTGQSKTYKAQLTMGIVDYA